jgi:hypothetical protein
VQWGILSGAAFYLTVCLTAAGRGPGLEQQAVASVPPADIEQAIQLAADERRSRSFLDKYVVQVRAGSGNGPLMGVFSTPFSRVVRAAAAARKDGRLFAASDVTQDMITPEVHVVVWQQPIAPGEKQIAGVRSVFIASRATRDPSDPVMPIKLMKLTTEYATLYGLRFEHPGYVATFPLSVLTRGNWIHITFNQVIRSYAAVSACMECVVPVPFDEIR